MNYKITNIPTYPKDGKHLQINLDIPVGIAKGEDPFFWTDPKTNNEYESKPQYWYVAPSNEFDNINSNGESWVKVFKNPDRAVRYAFKIYDEWLQIRINHLAKVKKEVGLQ